MELKRTTPVEKQLGDYTFFIKPFSAFLSANLSGKLTSLIGPLIGALIPMLGSADVDLATGEIGNENFMDMDIENAAPYFSQAMANLDGDQIEMLCKELLVAHENISVRGPITNYDVALLTQELADEIFCEEIQDLFILCFEVIKKNFKGFFKKLGIQSGSLKWIM